jgi:hypothetical protein
MNLADLPAITNMGYMGHFYYLSHRSNRLCGIGNGENNPYDPYHLLDVIAERAHLTEAQEMLKMTYRQLGGILLPLMENRSFATQL